MIRLEKCVDGSIPVKEMQDGDVGTITQWVSRNWERDYIGWVVQRSGDLLFCIGREERYSWYGVFEPDENTEGCRVRLLQDGDTLIYTKED